METKLFKSTIKLFILSILFLVISCDSDTTIIDNPQTNNPDNPTEDTDNGSVNSTVSATDKKLFSQLKKAGEEFDKNEIWNGYNFSSMPVYFIFRDENNNPVKGFLVSPKKEISGATKINGDNAQGLNVYSYDKDVTKANDLLKAGNDFFDFEFKIEDQNFYLQAYTAHDVSLPRDGAIQLAAHEVFHLYQFNWSFIPGYIQDEANYPINKDLLELQLLTTKIAAKMPAETNSDIIKKYLEMYVAIRDQEMALDPSPDKLVKNMANPQEHGEGTAKYVETMVAYKTIPNFNSLFDNIKFTPLNSKSSVRSYFAFGIWYDTGAAVAYMLKHRGVNIELATESGQTLFEVAEEHLGLSAAQKTQRLEQAKNEFNWSEIQSEAERLANLN